MSRALIEGADGRYQEALDTLMRGLAQLSGFEIATLALLREDGLFEFVSVVGDPEAHQALLGHHLSLASLEREIQHAQVAGDVRFVPSGSAPPDEEYRVDWIPDLPRPADDPGAWDPYDYLCVLMHDEERELRGLIAVDVPVDGRRPSAATLEGLGVYTAEIARTALQADARRRGDRQLELATRSREVIRQADAELGPEAVIAASLPGLLETFEADMVSFFLLGEDRLISARTERPERVLEAHEPRLVDAAGRVVAVLARDRRTLMRGLGHQAEPSLDAADVAAVDEGLRRVGFDLLLLVPLTAGSHVVGGMTLARRTASVEWSDLENAAARDLGRDLGAALHTADVFRQQRELAAYKQQLIATMAHELKNPIAAISGNVELLQEILDDAGLDDQDAAGRVRATLRAAGRLRDIVDDLLELSAAESTERDRPAAPTDLVRLVRDAVEQLQHGAAGKDQTLRTRLPAHPAPVGAHADDLLVLVTNLVGNAVKYTPARGRVWVEVARSPCGRNVVLEVTDTGPGIAAEDQERLFEEFFRTTAARAGREFGSGLGLAIVDRIVRRYDGSIEVESVLGRGATFRVTLPLAADPA